MNDLEKIIVMAEIKLDKQQINLETLRNKSKKLMLAFPDYKPEWLALGIENIHSYLELPAVFS